MPDNELSLMQWQVGSQTVFGTSVTPTTKLMGITEGEITPIVETSAITEQRGSLAPAYAASVDKITGEASLSGDLGLEQFGLLLDSLLGKATPGTGPNYARAYAAPLGTKPDPRMLTLVRGSALASKALKGAIVNELTIKGETNKRIGYEAKFVGHSVEDKPVAALSDTTPTYAHANQMAIKFDTWAGTMGATALIPIATTFELGLNMNRIIQMGLGSANPVDHKINQAEPDSNQLKLSMIVDATAAGYFQSIIAPSGTAPFMAQIQLGWTIGSLLLTIKYAGYAAEAPKFVSDSDGLASLDFVFSPMYHATLANWLKIDLTNATAAYV